MEAFVEKYSGYTVLKRLLFIGENCPEYSRKAFVVALKECEKGINTEMYQALHKAMKAIGLELLEHLYSKEFVEYSTKRGTEMRNRLEAELNSYKANLIKDSIRQGHHDLGNFFLQRGDLQSALKSFVRMRDFCTSSAQMVDMCLRVITVSIHAGNFSHVSNYAGKAEQSFNAAGKDSSDLITLSKIACSFGLAMLNDRKYHQAANRFTQCHIELGETFNEVIHPQDIGLYGGLCALATFSRSELKTNVIENRTFKPFLDLVPQLRDLVTDFHHSNYAASLKQLAQMKQELQMDIHLHPHLDQLIDQVRNRAIIGYFSPYLSVDMSLMAQAFEADPVSFEKELATLIMEGKISARIDSPNKVLYSRHADQRGSTYRKAFEIGQRYVADTRAILLRMSLIKNDLIIGQNGNVTSILPSSQPRRLNPNINRNQS